MQGPGAFLPFTPQSPAKTGAAAGNQAQRMAGTEGDPIGSALNEVMGRLQLPAPEPVPTPSVPQRILAGLADALMTRAQVLMKQAPEGMGATANLEKKQEAAKERNRQVEIGNRNTRNQVAMKLIEGDMIAKRQAEDDARKAEAEKIKSDAELRDKTVKSWIDTLQMPGFVEWWKRVNPGRIDPATDLSPDRISKIQESFLRDTGMTKDVAETVGKANVILSFADQAQQNAPPGMQLTGIQAGPYQYSVPKPDEAQKNLDYLSGPVTDTTARQLTDAGGNTRIGMTEQEALDLKAELKRKAAEEKAKLAQQRLNQKTKGGNLVKQEVAVLKDVKSNAEKALRMLTAYGDVGGPMAGRNFAVPTTLAWDYMTGSENYTHQIEVDDALSAVRAPVKKGFAGTAVSVGEFADIHPMLPYLTDSYTKKVTNLKKIIERADKGLENRKLDYGLTTEDIDSIGDPNYVPPVYPQGAIQLGSN